MIQTMSHISKDSGFTKFEDCPGGGGSAGLGREVDAILMERYE